MNFDTIINRKGTYCTQWDYIKDRFGVDDLLPFTISDMDFEAPKEIIDAVMNRVNHKVFGYSRWNHDDFKDSIKLWYKKRFNFSINKEWILYSPNVMYSVSNLIRMKSKTGDNVLIFTPVYDGFFKTIKANNRNIITSALKIINNRYQIDFDDFEKKCLKSKILLFCSPHNPTGIVWTSDELKRVVDICKMHNVYIISDEIHMDIVYNRHTPIFSINNYKNIALCSSPSKTFNISSLSSSYLLVRDNSDREEFLHILKDRDSLSSPQILGIIASIEAYNKCDYWIDKALKYIENNIKYVIDYINKNIPDLKCYMPEGTYFTWIDYSNLNISNKDFQKYLINIGKVAIMDGVTYGEDGKFFIRINCACPMEKIKECMNKINNTIEYIKSNHTI